MATAPFDVLVGILRIAFVGLLYLFLLQVMRVLTKQVRVPEVAPMEPEELEPEGRLVIVDPGKSSIAQGAVLPLQPVNPIGRRAENAIVLDDEFVSGEHALLAWRDEKWWLSDVASTNGTFINGVEIQEPTVVAKGDVLTFGRIKAKLL
ncbi:MAG: FHA domain-containing protein [Chloroflexi bacterium]|nr:FHA domain-containing protein [Chloroflexota bacterium]